MSWADGDIFGFDTETGGVSVFDDRIVTTTVVKVPTSGEPITRTWLINSGVPIPAAAQAIHGITTEHAQEHGVDAATAVEEIAQTVAGVLRSGRPLVAFNASFDLSILEAELRRYGLTSLFDRVEPDHWHTVIDPMVLGQGIDMIAKRFVKGRKYTLPALCDRYKVPFTESHDATADATGAVLLAKAISDSDLYLASLGPAAIHQLQVTWRREKMLSLAAYFDKEGIEHDVDPGWPLHSRLLQEVKTV